MLHSVISALIEIGMLYSVAGVLIQKRNAVFCSKCLD